MRLSEKAIDYPRLVIVGAVAICFFGWMALRSLPLERTPRVMLPLILVATPNLGASPEDVESDIVEEIEEEAKGLDDLDYYESMSASGAGVVQFKFLDDADIDEAREDVQELVNRKKRELPDSAEEPNVIDISFTDWPILNVVVTGLDDPKELRRIAEELQDRIEAVPGIASADLFGGREREVQVLVNPERMVQLGLGYEDVARAVTEANRDMPGGETEGDSLPADVVLRGKFRTVEEIENVVVAARPGGNILVRDLAKVVDGFKKVRTLASSYAVKGVGDDRTLVASEAVVLQVRGKADINTLEAIDNVNALIAREQERLGDHVSLNVTGDTGREIRIMTNQLGGSALFGVALVVIVLWIFMGLRNALTIAFAIPFSILFTFAILFAVKHTIDEDAAINNMVLFSLILIIGMVIDGALIVGENIFRHVEGGMDRAAAAKLGIREVGGAVIAADLTTIAAFSPMLMVSGVMGQFLKFMPIVVTMALCASIMVDHFLLPVVARYVMRAGKGRFTADVDPAELPEGPGEVDEQTGHVSDATTEAVRRSADAAKFGRTYRGVIEWALRHRAIVVILAVSAVATSVGAVAGGLVGFEFFPKSDLAMFRINYEMPPGTPVEQTMDAGREICTALDSVLVRDELQSEPVIVCGEPGAFAAQFGDAKTGPEYGTVTVELVLADQRERSTAEIVAELRTRLPNLPQVKDIRIREQKEGPPSGAALAIRIKGSADMTVDELGRKSEELEQLLRRTPGAKDVTSDWQLQRKIVVEPKRQVAALAGINEGQIRTYEAYAINGLEVAESNFGGDEKVEIRLQNAPEFRDREALRRLPIRGATGQVRDLATVADVRDDVLSPYAIYHRDGDRVVNLRTEAQPGYIADQIEAGFRQQLDRAGVDLSAVTLDFGGENEERDQSMEDLSGAWIIGVVLIVVILVVQFNSFTQPAVVMLAIPLSFVGVILGLAVMDYNFSIATMIGVVALAGIVVNDAIVLVTFISQLRALGMSKSEAIVRAGQLRLRPIFLTTITTIVGLLPLALDVTGGGEFWRPLTTAVMFGLAFATVLTLVVLPTAYSLLVREGRAAPSPVAGPPPLPAGD